jgi:putative aldouronate transport system substrate-binding protein
MVVNKKFEHPEALFDLINIWFENMFKQDLTEEEYQTYAVSENYAPQNYAYNIGLWPYINPRIDNIRGVNAGTIDPETLTGESKQIWLNIKAYEEGNYYPVSYDHYWNHSFRDHSSMSVRWKIFEKDATISDLFYGSSTPTMLEKMSTLEKIRDETIIQIITGEKPVSEFDRFVADWHRLGGDDIIREMNDWYAKQ